jgi:hypothetical protein
MEWIDRYRHEVVAIFALAEEETASYPAPLDELGRAWVHRLDPLRGAPSNYIGYLLPYWIRETADIELTACRDLAAANIHALIHFFLLDDVIDTGSGMDKAAVRDSLVLGQLFQASFQRRYARYYAPESSIWTHYRRYLAEWAHAVAHENVLQANPDDPRLLAGKSAPVKLSAAGMLLLADREAMLPEMEDAIDLTLATLQLSDDWADWREDLAEGNDSAFLALVRRCLSVPADHPLDERQVKRAIYHAGCLDRLADTVESYMDDMAKLTGVPPMLEAFHRALALGIRADANIAVETTKQLATGGTFDYFLSNLSKN